MQKLGEDYKSTPEFTSLITGKLNEQLRWRDDGKSYIAKGQGKEMEKEQSGKVGERGLFFKKEEITSIYVLDNI